MLLVYMWENLSFARVFSRVIRLIQMLLVSVGECIICTCFCIGFIRLIEMLLVCLWENVLFARVFKGLYT